MYSSLIALQSVVVLSVLCVLGFVSVKNPTLNELNELCFGIYETMQREKVTSEVASTLRTLGYVSNNISDEDLQRYILYAEQFSSLYDGVDSGLTLAVIGVESRFNPDAVSSGFIGLGQLGPNTHRSRMQALYPDLEVSFESFYEPEMSIHTMVDYLSYILEETETYKSVPPEDKELFGLMWYNQGAISASSTYFDGNRHISHYANEVEDLASTIREIYEKGEWLWGDSGKQNPMTSFS